MTSHRNRSIHTGWTIAVIVAMLVAAAVFAVALFAASDVRSQQTVPPGCLANNRCWEAGSVPSRYDDCKRERLYDPAKFSPSKVYEPADGKQPSKKEYEKTQTMTWKTGDRRYCAGVNFCPHFSLAGTVTYKPGRC